MNQWDQNYMEPAQEITECQHCGADIEEGYYCSKDCEESH
jgi:hypothetical protein